MNRLLITIMIFLGVGLAPSAFAGLDTIRPQCVNSCRANGGDPQVCYVNCWFCNAHNSSCPEFRYFCGYQENERIGWLVNVTTSEARFLGTNNFPGVAYRAHLTAPQTFEITKVDSTTQLPIGAVGTLQQLSFNTASINGVSLTRQACEPQSPF